jgi:hypothetical protein
MAAKKKTCANCLGKFSPKNGKQKYCQACSVENKKKYNSGKFYTPHYDY